MRENEPTLQYQANTSPIIPPPTPSRNIRPVGRRSTGGGGYMSKLMVGSMAGLLVMQGFGEQEQANDRPTARGLLGLPTEYMGRIGHIMQSLGQSNAAESAPLLRSFHILFKFGRAGSGKN